MSEGELQVLANDGYDLTDIAREALKAELAARGLNIRLRDTPRLKGVAQFSEDLTDLSQVEGPAQARMTRDGVDSAKRPVISPVKSVGTAEEWHRFKETYSLMSEDELQRVVDDAYDLTDIAREALQAEIFARGLSIRLSDTPQVKDVPQFSEDLIVIDQVWSYAQARQAQDILVAVGVPSYLGPDNLVNVDDYSGSFEDGVDLKVKGHDMSAAYGAFYKFKRSRPQEEKEPTDDTQTNDSPFDYDIRCPKCRCLEIIFEGRDPEPETGPARDAKFNWTCEECGHHWKDDGIEQKIG